METLPPSSPVGLPSNPNVSVSEPNRCFICLTDDFDAPELSPEWLYPSPCSLLAHQSCMLAWVRNRELENKPLECPVCLNPITLDQPSDSMVSLADFVGALARQAAPRVLIVLLMAGTTTGMALYGMGALWVFAGRDAVVGCLRDVSGLTSTLRYRRVMALPLIGPALVLGYNVGPLPMPISLPMLAVYGSYLVGFDPGTFSWPPSPSMVLTVFPYLQLGYRALYQALFQDFEDELDRKLDGLPPALVDDPPAAAPTQAQQQEQPVENPEDEDQSDRPLTGRLRAILNEVRIALNFIQHVDVDVEAEFGPPDGLQADEQGFNVNVELGWEEEDGEEVNQQLQLEDGDGEMPPLEETEPLIPPQVLEDPWADATAIQHEPIGNPRGLAEPDEEVARESREAQQVFQYPQNHPAVPGDDSADRAADLAEAQAILPNAAANAARENANANGNADAQPAAAPAELPAAPIPQPGRQGLATTVSQMCLNIATALALPGISYCMGEILRAMLPRRLTMMAKIPSWSGMPRYEHTGLLQTRWGRSLVGGCLYIVLRDVVRLYVKYRRSNITGSRKVRGFPRGKEEEKEGKEGEK